MSIQNKVPFNISLLKPTVEMLRNTRKISTMDIFDGSSKNFHPDGLFSTQTFGPVGDERRTKRFGYIDLKIEVLHPVIYRRLTQLKAFYEEIISSKGFAVWDESTSDFVKSNPIDGSTGYNFFMKYWRKIKFEKSASDMRELNIKVVEKHQKNNEGTYDALVVLPAGMRDFEIAADGRQNEDEINGLYRKIMSIVNPISDAAVKNNPEILDLPRSSLQRTLNELYAHLESMLDGKKKIMLAKWAARKVFNGTRNVITADTTKIVDLFDEGNPTDNHSVVGIYQGLKGILPKAIFMLRNGILANTFGGPNAPANLIDKKTLKRVSVKVRPNTYDTWMTDEGLERVISSFKEESIRHKTLEIESHYVALLYKDKEGRFKVFYDIDELPKHLDKSNVTPITFTELLYLSVYKEFNKYPIFITRYPITGYGSIYPSLGYLKPTTNTEKCFELDNDWETIVGTANEFPIRGSTFINSLSLAHSHLALLGGDHDGDVCSANFVYFDESIDEVQKLLDSARYYRNTDGGVAFSVVDGILERVIYGMTA